jgi:cytochrome c5
MRQLSGSRTAALDEAAAMTVVADKEAAAKRAAEKAAVKRAAEEATAKRAAEEAMMNRGGRRCQGLTGPPKETLKTWWRILRRSWRWCRSQC